MSLVGTGDAPQNRERLYRSLVLALVVVLALTWGAVVWLLSGKSKAEEDLEAAERKVDAYAAGPEARDAAEALLEEMVSFDHASIDTEYQWLASFSPELRAEYEDEKIPSLRKVIKLTKAEARGEIVETAYETSDPEHVTVLAFIRQRITDARNRRGLVEEQWATLKMGRSDGEWLIDDIDIVSVPPPS
jgi:hypothetical protein